MQGELEDVKQDSLIFKRWLFVSGVNLDGEPVKQPVMAKWMTRVPRKAEEK